MSIRRRELLQRLTETIAGAATSSALGDCAALCFQVMYGLPWEVQLGIARFMGEHYLPILEAKQPSVRWARALIEDVPGWYAAQGRAVPDEPESLDSADAAYMFYVASILYAYQFRSNQGSLTAACCCAITHVVHARALNVWVADDPEGVLLQDKIMELGRTGEPYPESGPFAAGRLFAPEHQPHNNVAYVAVARREWTRVSQRLSGETVVEPPEPDDIGAVARALERWRDHEFLLMKPEEE